MSEARVWIPSDEFTMAGLEARVWRTQRFVSATSSVIHSGFIPSAGWRASSSSFPEALRLVSSIIASGCVGHGSILSQCCVGFYWRWVVGIEVAG